MAFYDLAKNERRQLVESIGQHILHGLKRRTYQQLLAYFGDEDTYIRKAAYLSTGRIYLAEPGLQNRIVKLLHELLDNSDFKIRQTAVNAAGEIGTHSFDIVETIFDTALFDAHHAVRNAVIGSVKKMGQKNPKPVLAWAKKYLHHANKEIRREICHGIELRGRTHPQDILPLLKELQFDGTARVSNTLVHVLGQIAYKKGCLAIVIEHLNDWQNKALVKKALHEIVDVHHRYKNFSALTQKQAAAFIKQNSTL